MEFSKYHAIKSHDDHHNISINYKKMRKNTVNRAFYAMTFNKSYP